MLLRSKASSTALLSCTSVHVTFSSKPNCPSHCMSVCVCVSECVFEVLTLLNWNYSMYTFVCLLLILQIQDFRKESHFYFIWYKKRLIAPSKYQMLKRTIPFGKQEFKIILIKFVLFKYIRSNAGFLSVPGTLFKCLLVITSSSSQTTLWDECHSHHTAGEGVQLRKARSFARGSGPAGGRARTCTMGSTLPDILGKIIRSTRSSF